MAKTKKPLVFRDRNTKEKIPYYVKTEDVQLPDGTDIETKIGEIEEALDGAADGTVKSVTLNNVTVEPDANGNVDLGEIEQAEQKQADWSETDTTDPAYIKHKPTKLSDFTNDEGFTDNAGTVTGVKMNDGNAATPDSNGVVDLGTVITSHQSLAALFGRVAYDGTTHRINFYGKDDVSMTTVLGYIDCSPFIVDGMLSNVEVKNVTINNVSTPCMVFSFNTDAGKQNINIPVSSIFNAANYYTKDDADGRFQLKLVSGTNIKTVNNTSILGEGNITIPAGESAYDIAVDEGFEGTEAQWLASLKGEKGDQGDTVVLDPQALPQFTIVNDLTTGGGGSALSAEMGVLLKQNIVSLFNSLSTLYSKLGNIAFWDAADKAAAAPTALDWHVPKKTLTIVNSIANGIVKYNGDPVITPIQVDMGTTVELLVVGDEGYAIASCAASGATVFNNGDGTFTVSVKVDDTMTLTITGTAAAVKSITLVAKDFAGRTLTDALSISVSQVASGADLAATIELLDTYFDAVAISSVKDASNNDVTYTYSNGVISIEDVTSNITITATVTKTLKIYTGKSLTSHGSSVTDSTECYTDYIRLDKIDMTKTMVWAYQHGAVDSSTASLSKNLVFYNSDKKKIYVSSQWDSQWVPKSFTAKTNNSRTLTTSELEGLLTAAGTKLPLYVRASFKKNGNALTSGCGLTQDGVGLFDPSSVASATEPTIHNVTYTENGAFCNCTRNMSVNPPTAFAQQSNVIDGENFETFVSAESGKTITSVTVTMGGVDITATSWDATNNKITINSVTGALVITTNAS